jgi:transposase-like protein
MSLRTQRYRLCAARGMSVNEVARLYEVTPHAIRKANREHNLGFGVRHSPRDRDLVAMRDRVEALAAQGKTQTAVSLELRVPMNTIRRWSRAWGVQWARHGGKQRYVDRLRAHLSDKEAEDLLFVTHRRFTYREALGMIGRADLLEMIP